MKVLFLDIDGVLNHAEFLQGKALVRGREGDVLDPLALARLEGVLATTEARVVLSTSWRLRYSLEEMGALFRGVGGRRLAEALVDTTPSLLFAEHRRGAEIRAWLAEHPVERYAVVDDEVDDILPVIPAERVVTTDFAGSGLDRRAAEALVATLGGVVK